jgi:ABC-type transport system involved in cytochrome c biogenesis permease subunit
MSTLKTILRPLASLRLTVVLLALSMVLIMAGTWAQIDHDVWTVQKRYFHSFLAWVSFGLFLPRQTIPDGSAWKPIVEFLRPIGFPMPGGYSIIALLLLNLVAAHSVRFKLNRKRLGIILIHGGLILLILGEVVTSIWQVEGTMTIDEGQTVQFTENSRKVELAVIDTSAPDTDTVTVIPASRLVRQGTISYPTLPFEIQVEKYLANSAVLGPFQAKQFNVEPNSIATAGVGKGLAVVEQPKVTGTAGDAGRIDAPSAFITLTVNGKPLDTYLVSLHLGPQAVEVDGKTWQIALRKERTYKPYALTLLDFTHDRYTGTNTPKNFASRVRLVDPSRGEDREVLIWMNHPLRFAGETFYQASFDERTDLTTVLQVVRNPGWLIPYISCTIVALGMLIHFGAHLVGFISRAGQDAPAGAPAPRHRPVARPQQYTLKPRSGIALPLLVTAACGAYLLFSARPPTQQSPFDLNTFARVPLSYEGRILPMDTLANVSLRVLSGKATLSDSGKRIPAIQWLADVFAKPEKALNYRVFRVDHPDLKNVLQLDPNRKLFSREELFKRPAELQAQYEQARAVPPKSQNLYQKAVLDLAKHLFLFNRLTGIDTLFLAPPTQPGEEWKMFAEAHTEAQNAPLNPGVRAFESMVQSYHNDRADLFNAAAGDYVAYFRTLMPGIARRVSAEVVFNWVKPFYRCMELYILVFLLTCAAWLVAPWRATLTRTAFWVLLLTLGVHTLGLAARIYIQGRPPVTNLYSSAIFIGWAAVVFCAGIELLFRNGIGALAAAVVAFPSLLVAHFLSGSGDTMQMLQAVLDTNFWLATHVVVITIGYAATFLAGIVGCFFVIGSFFPAFTDETRKTLSRMVYGVVCFALLFSFVGTILGGIWADQSWGRFWGWDPKENGAVLIVLWNAIILHARWGGLVRDRGLALLAIFGNIVTAWSWFGTNMLGIGLHSYGFMDSAVFWLGLFMASQLVLIGIGNLPSRRLG